MNFAAILLATVLNIAIGWFWYSPALFGKQWINALGWDKKKLDKETKDANITMTMVLISLTTLFTTVVLAVFIRLANATNAGAGMAVAFWIWLGFIVTTNASTVLFERRSPKVYYIYILYQFVAFLTSGAIIGAWN